MSASPRATWRRGLSLFAACAGVLLALMWVRALAEARVALSHAEALAAHGSDADRRLALAGAVRWAAPLNGYASRATAALLELAESEERQARPQAALVSYRALRGSLLSAAGIVRSHSEVLRLADDKIAELSVRSGRSRSGDVSRLAQRRERVTEQLRASAQSSPARLLALLGFVGWVSAAFLLAAAGFDPEGRLRPRPALSASAGVLVGFGCFCLGLWAA